MSQPSVANYFNTRKRTINEDHKISRARKVLVLDCGDIVNKSEETTQDKQVIIPNKIALNPNKNEVNKSRKIVRKTKKVKEVPIQQDIQQLLTNLNTKVERCVTPPPKEQVKKTSKELNEIKRKLTRSSRLDELRASINRFKESSTKLKETEKRTSAISDSPKLKTFRTIELEVELSPQKIQSPEKAYLSPKKESSSVRKNLLNLLSPTKNSVPLPESPSKKILESIGKAALTLPFKYRYLAEIFRCIDTISQMLYNRKEVITFKKIKTAVEEMLKRNLTLKHIAQIKTIFPDAFDYKQEKLRVFGTGMKQENWELVLIPTVESDRITSEMILERRRKLFHTLLDRVKDYHNEFLLSLEPPMIIEKAKVTRWHPEFDLEKIPDLELSDLPQPPNEEKLTTGKEVLEKARQMFQCNARMEKALEKLKNKPQECKITEKPSQLSESLLKGIPKALLEKVRERQAAKALVSMTRSVDKDKEIQLYSRLPELARLTRNLFVSEKKSVLPLDMVVEKLGNSYRCFLTKSDLEEHLNILAKECPDWLIFHNIRSAVYLKLMKNSDLSIILNKLENLVKCKTES